MPCINFQWSKKSDTGEVAEPNDNLNKHEIPEHLQAGGSNVNHVGNVYTNTSLSEHVREKRGLLGLAVSILGKLSHYSH